MRSVSSGLSSASDELDAPRGGLKGETNDRRILLSSPWLEVTGAWPTIDGHDCLRERGESPGHDGRKTELYRSGAYDFLV